MTDAMEARLIDAATGKSADVFWLNERVEVRQPDSGTHAQARIVGRSLGAYDGPLYDVEYGDGARELNVAAARITAVAP